MRSAIVFALTSWHRRRIAAHLRGAGFPHSLGRRDSLTVRGDYEPLAGLLTDLRHRFPFGFCHGFVVSAFSPDELGMLVPGP